MHCSYPTSTAAHERRFSRRVAMSSISPCGSLRCPDRGISFGFRLSLTATKRTLAFDFRSGISDSSAFMATRSPVGWSDA
jgi:hypothetical protein